MELIEISKKNFYLLFIATVIALLMFDPGTNGRNLTAFSNIKLVGFFIALVTSMLVLLMPVLVFKNVSTRSYLYFFLLLVFIPVNLFYLFNIIILFVR